MLNSAEHKISTKMLKNTDFLAFKLPYVVFILLINVEMPTIVGIFKGDISRFFIFHCKFLLYVGFNVFIKNPDYFPQCSVIK